MTPPLPGKRAGVDASSAEPTQAALDWMQRAGAVDEVLLQVATQVRRRRRRRVAMLSASAAAVLVAGLLWPVVGTREAARDIVAAQATSPTISKPARRDLPDGTITELKDGAEIAIAFRPDQRRVTLVRGEAHFKVTKDEARPFVVVARGVEVRAVGTAFAVQLGDGAIEVLVTEGRVAVDKPLAPNVAAAAAETVATLDAGFRAVVGLDAQSPPPQVEAVPEAQLADRLAWRIPQLEFSRTPLAQIVALMNDHAAGTSRPCFVIADRRLNDVALSGFLRADNTEGLVRLLETNFGVRAEREGAAIVLRRAQ